MKTDYFKKVYIKSEADLPKEEGYYFVGTKANTDRKMDLFYWRFTNFAQGRECWLNDIDWYLLPVSIPSDEEIEKWAEEESKVEIEEDGEVKTYSTCISEFYIEGAKWMRDELTAK